MTELLITGGTGMVGKAIQRLLPQNYDAVFVGSKQYNLLELAETKKMLREIKPQKIIHLAAKVGGVKANSEFLADFYNENILINTNVLMAAHEYNVQNIVSLLSTCVYPDKDWVNYPLTEEQLHNGPPHESNFGYAYAKRMVEVQSRAYRIQHKRNYTTAIPNNIFGPEDNFDLNDGHVVPAVIRKIYEAKLNDTDAKFWGNGEALREFTYSEDIAAALLKMIGYPNQKTYNESAPANIGNNEEVSIKELVETVSEIFGYKGNIIWDANSLSGQYRKPSKASKIMHEYKSLKDGLILTCKWFEENYPNVRGI